VYSTSGNAFSLRTTSRARSDVSRSVAPGVARKATWYSPRLKSGMKSPPRIASMGNDDRNATTAIPTTASRWRRDQPSSRSYFKCRSSNHLLKRASARPSRFWPPWPAPSTSGSTQRDDNMGSRVKLTNSDTSTAAATVIPNS
jgi:hypothetical protein